jgi:hypothetical protein
VVWPLRGDEGGGDTEGRHETTELVARALGFNKKKQRLGLCMTISLSLQERGGCHVNTSSQHYHKEGP